MLRFFKTLAVAGAFLMLAGCSKDNPQSDVDYKVYHDKRTTLLETFCKTSIELRMAGTGDSEQEKLINIVKGVVVEDEVAYYDFEYPSLDPHGLPVTLSARLYVPGSAYSGKTCNGLALANHYSLLAAENTPTRNHTLLSLPVWLGYAVVVPDYYGKGVSEDRCQLLFDSALNSRNSFDALTTSFSLLGNLGIDYDEERIYNYGYSEGGGVAVGCQRIAALHPELGVHFHKTMAGGSPVDIVDIMRKYQVNRYPEGMSFLAYSLANVIAEGLVDLEYSDVFTKEMLPDIEEFFLSKKYESGQVEHLMKGRTYENTFTADVLSGEGRVCETLEKYLAGTSIHQGWGIPAGTCFYLYATPKDCVIPFSNYETLKTNLTDHPSEGELNFREGAAASHGQGALEFFAWSLGNW